VLCKYVARLKLDLQLKAPDIHHKGWPAVEDATLKIYKDRTKLLRIPRFPTVSCCSFLYVNF